MKRFGIILAMLCTMAVGGLYPAAAPATNLVYQAQEALKDLGYDPGPSDGEYGPRTEEALRQFQRENGLPVTGRLNDATIAKLGRRSGRLRNAPGAGGGGMGGGGRYDSPRYDSGPRYNQPRYYR